MAPEFLDAPRHPGDRVWRRSSWGAIGSGTAMVACAGLGAAMTFLLGTFFVNGALTAVVFLAWLVRVRVAVFAG